jgi:hypothetical protein
MVVFAMDSLLILVLYFERRNGNKTEDNNVDQPRDVNNLLGLEMQDQELSVVLD